MRANRGDDLILARRDGQFQRVSGTRRVEPALLAKGNGGAHLLAQPFQQSLALIRVMTVAQNPREPPSQPHPVGQQALRQQRLQFFNSGIDHAASLNITDPARRRKAGGDGLDATGGI